jgi:hypothetical protein
MGHTGTGSCICTEFKNNRSFVKDECPVAGHAGRVTSGKR